MASEPSRWAPIEMLIGEFQGFLAKDVPQLKIEKGVDCAESFPVRKAVSGPLRKRGVYLVFDDSESLRYIGMTISRSLIYRCRDQLRSKPLLRLVTPRWIDVIPFDRKFAFLAPSLESYLIIQITSKEGSALVNRLGAEFWLDLENI